MKRNFFFCFMVVLFISCHENTNQIDFKILKRQSPPVIILADSIKVEGDLGPFKKTIKSEKLEDGLQIVTITFETESMSELQPVTIKFNFPSVDVNGYWNPTFDGNFNFWRSGFTSRASSWAPVLSYYNNSLENRITFALSDALNKVDLSCYLKEEDVYFYPKFRFF